MDVLSRARRVGNILRFGLKSRYRAEMLRKLRNRIDGLRNAHRNREAAAWYEQRSVEFGAFAASESPRLWQESLECADAAKRTAREKLTALGETMGGGTASMLYFLVRARKPRCVVETGVAAGFSSQAILRALKLNNQGGRLFSSDFPYFRKSNPESLVGVAVDPALRDRWTLYLDGDRANLPRIARSCGPIDLLVYDSDKSRSGRAFAIEYLVPLMSDAGLIVMDDIDDNDFFKDLVASTRDFRIFRYNGRYVGMVAAAALREGREHGARRDLAAAL